MDHVSGGHTLVILAAGVGSRFGGDKQIEAIGPSGETIMDYSIYDALQAEFARVVFVIREEMESAFHEQFDRNLAGCCEALYVYQRLDDVPEGFVLPAGRSRPWGTAQAVLACRGVVDGPFVVINADDFYGRDAFEAISRFMGTRGAKDSGDSALVGRRVDRMLSPHGHVSRGICHVDEQGYLLRIEERHGVGYHDGEIGYLEGSRVAPLSPDVMASMSMWGFQRGVIAEVEDLFVRFLRADESELLQAELPISIVTSGKARKIRFIESADHWFGLTHQEDLAEVRVEINRRVRKAEYPCPLWSVRD